MRSGLYTMFLFARPSFVEGVGRLWDFGDTLTEFNRSPTGQVADYLALSSDWAAIGEDLSTALQQYETGAIVGEEPSEAHG